MLGQIFKNVKLILLTTICFSSCYPNDKEQPIPPITNEEKVLVVCEGSLGNGNGQLDIFYPSKDSIYNNVFESINNRGLGDIFQSVTLIDSNYYLCINNSDKIEVVNQSLLTIKTIAAPKPRYIVPTSADLFFVSSLFHNQVYCFSSISNQLIDSISFPYKNTESLLLAQDKLWISCWDTACRYIYEVNIQSRKIEDSIHLSGCAPQEILKDKYNRIWVLSGNKSLQKPSFLECFDINNKQLIKSFPFPSDAEPMRLTMNAALDTLYFLEVNYTGATQNNGVFRMPVSASVLPNLPFIPAQVNQYFWGLGIHPQSGNIYVGDPKGFIQSGAMLIYDNNGNFLRTHKTGVGPGHFYFQSK